MNEILQQRYTTDCIESTADVDEGPVTHIHFIYDVIFTALCGEYKAEQNRWRELGVLPSFIAKPFWKYTNIQVLMTLKARKDFMVFKQRDLLWSGLL